MVARSGEFDVIIDAWRSRPVAVPDSCSWPRRRPDDPIVEFVKTARNWPQPMQDDLIPILMANGFRTADEQAKARKHALLRAAALDATAGERRAMALRYGRPKAIRAVWWLRRRFGRDRFEG